MRALVGALILSAVAYQLFFRYEQIPVAGRDGAVYEHDNLTGATRTVKPGEETDWLSRLFGTPAGGAPGRFLKPLDLSRDWDNSDNKGESAAGDKTLDLTDAKEVAKAAKPVPVPNEVVVASSEPPVPMMLAIEDTEPQIRGIETSREERPFAVRQVDLNKDGDAEEIIQNALQSDGLLDISIVRHGREIFYGRGKQISLLPSRSHEGWADVALKDGSNKILTVFRYNPKDAVYKAFEGQ